MKFKKIFFKFDVKNIKYCRNVYLWLEEILIKMTDSHNLKSTCLLTKDIHIYPDFHGNRSPLSDPSMTGMVSINVRICLLNILYLTAK